MQLPKTQTLLSDIEALFERVEYDPYTTFNEEELYLIEYPMLHLAETIYDENELWAVALAKYILTMKEVEDAK